MTALRIAGARRAFSAWAYLALLGWTFLLVALLPQGRLAWLLAALLVFAVAAGADLRPVLVNPRLWLFLGLMVVLGGLFLGPADTAFAGVRYSAVGLAAGVAMSLRALAITLAFSATLGVLSVGELSLCFERLGLKGLGFALGVALNMAAGLGDMASTCYHSCRLRGGFRRHHRRNAGRLLVALVTSALRRGDEVVLAASARAFDPAGRRAEPAPLTRADAGVFLVLAVVAAALLLV